MSLQKIGFPDSPASELDAAIDSTGLNYHFNILSLGDPKVGRSSIAAQITMSSAVCYPKDPAPEKEHTVIKVYEKNLTVAGNQVKITVNNHTQGRRDNKNLLNNLCKRADAIILVCDVTNRESFDHLPQYLRELEYRKDDCAIILVATKSDCVPTRAISNDELITFAEQKDLAIVALANGETGEHVQELLSTIINPILKRAIQSNYLRDIEAAIQTIANDQIPFLSLNKREKQDLKTYCIKALTELKNLVQNAAEQSIAAHVAHIQAKFPNTNKNARAKIFLDKLTAGKSPASLSGPLYQLGL